MAGRKTRIGVVADTHCPEFIDTLPDRVFRALSGVQVIVHAGDVTEASTLEQLAAVAPVEAVRGDHDEALASLPETRELVVEGLRIVVVHGQRSRWIEEPQTLLWTLSLGFFKPHQGLPRSLRRRFPDADVIVFGHTHRPHAYRVDGALLFNPGAVHQWNRSTARRRLAQKPGWFEWCWLQVARYMVRSEEPTVGILEIDEDGILPRIIGI
ncbi:MAG TPA: metallophosphoesterase family protein [Verrucomicrobiae bacterium]|nr:metallophosphoesterase family protein [Verrucomicrobiae bacterium]